MFKIDVPFNFFIKRRINYSGSRSTLLIVSLFIAVFSPGCRLKNNKEFESLLKPTELKAEVNAVQRFSEFLSGVEFIALREPKNLTFGEVDKVYIKENRIYVFDYFNSKRLIVYDLSGEFKYMISQWGEGPGEYLEVQDYLVDGSNVEILDVKNKVLVFDTLGKFVNEIKLNFVATAFAKISNNKYLFSSRTIASERWGSNVDCLLLEALARIG
jgi:hypothetical protein